MANKELVKFIIEAKKRGYNNQKISEALLNSGWPIEAIEEAFSSLQPKIKIKDKICVYLDNEVMHKLLLRAKKNMFTISEQIEDILRRSVLSSGKKTKETEKLDDALVTLFSRRKRGR